MVKTAAHRKFDTLLRKATNKSLEKEDLESMMEICDLITQNDCQPKYAVASIKKKILNQNSNVAVFGLQVLESIVKNCGSPVHDEVATKPFMEDLRDLAKTTQHENVRDKILELVQTWAHAFRRLSTYRAVQDVLNIMKAEGAKFPPLAEADAMFVTDCDSELTDNATDHVPLQHRKVNHNSGKSQQSSLDEILKEVMAASKADSDIIVHGLLYAERCHTFIQENWPYVEPHQLYNPHNLAMAGFVFLSKEPVPTARCFVCFETIECVDDDGGDPWLKHIAMKPQCEYVKLGYRSDPDDCTMSEALVLCEASWTNKFGKLSQFSERYILESIHKIAAAEDGFD